MTEGDLGEVLQIEKLSFPTPWTLKIFLNELENPVSHIVLAKDEAGILLGFTCFWIVADEAHIMSIAVHPKFRRHGVAKKLLGHILAFSKDEGATYFALEVRCRNLAAIEFYKGFGFRQVGVRKGYYGDTGEDAILMELEV